MNFIESKTIENTDFQKEIFITDDGLKILKGDMDYYYDADPEIQSSEEKIEYYKVMISTLTDIVTNINWRHQTISNIIRWRAFEAGA